MNGFQLNKTTKNKKIIVVVSVVSCVFLFSTSEVQQQVIRDMSLPALQI